MIKRIVAVLLATLSYLILVPSFAPAQELPSRSVFVDCILKNPTVGYHPGNEDDILRTISVVRNGATVWTNSEISAHPAEITEFNPNAHFIVQEGDEIWYPTVSTETPYMTIGHFNCGSSTTTSSTPNTSTTTGQETTSTTSALNTSTTEPPGGSSTSHSISAPTPTLAETGVSDGIKQTIMVAIIVLMLGGMVIFIGKVSSK